MEEKSRKPEDTPFKQQKLKAWQPILTPNWVIGTFAVVGLIFIPIGIVLHSESDNVVEYSVLYDTPGELDAQSKESIVQLGNGCMLKEEKEGNTFDIKTHGCTITFTLGKDMKAPIYVYYQLDNFYQNHRRYVQSRSDAQLRGDANAGTNDCAPLQKTPSDVIKYNSTYGILNEEKKTYFLNPCGLIANSLFNDIFWVNRIVTKDNQVYGRNDTYGDKQVINLMNQSGIAWKSDVETKFQNIKENQLKEDNLYLWQNEKYRNIIPSRVGQEPRENVTAWTTNAPAYGVQDEHFIVWMRTAGLPNFRKLYGRIETDLEKGTKLEFLVSSNFVVSTFDGKKSLVISTTSWFGGRNPFLGIAYIVVGSLCMVLAILFFAKHKLSPRKLGDTRYLVWKNNH